MKKDSMEAGNMSFLQMGLVKLEILNIGERLMTLIFEAEVVGCTFFRFFSLYPPFQMPGSVTKACADESIGLKELRELPRFVGVKHLLILKMLF